MLSASPEYRPVWSYRLFLICLAAVSVSLPMAWISLAKVMLVLSGLGYLIADHCCKRSDPAFQLLWTPRAVLVILVTFGLSLLWTDINLEIALLTLVKHSKLVEILLLVFFIRTVREARIGITAFACGQAFVLFNSWLLAASVPLPWVAHQDNPGSLYVVFAESYLDQSIMFATSAAAFWHLRFDQLWPRWLAGVFAVAAMANVFLLLPGRTGYLIAIALLSLAAMWAVPKRLRLPILVIAPLLLLLGAYFGSHKAREGISRAVNESQNYTQQPEAASSSGWRLNAWHRSLQAMKESPWIGHGVGSWAITVKRFEGSTATQTFGAGNASNPHQEYLLWGVELGIGGTALLLTLLISVMRDSWRFSNSIMRSLVSVVAATTIACLFNSALYDDLMGDFFCILLGLVLALGVRTALNPTDPTISTAGLVPSKANA